MRVLGVDPGLTRCGIGVVDGGTRGALHCAGVGVVRSSTEQDRAARLRVIADGVEEWIDHHRPEVVVVERVFSQNNVSTVMGTAQVSGVVALAAARRQLPVSFHTPSEVKAAISGSGRADKRQVTTMVGKILGLGAAPKPADAADALALAICHHWRAPMSSRLVEAEARAQELARNHRARLRRASRPRTGEETG